MLHISLHNKCECFIVFEGSKQPRFFAHKAKVSVIFLPRLSLTATIGWKPHHHPSLTSLSGQCQPAQAEANRRAPAAAVNHHDFVFSPLRCEKRKVSSLQRSLSGRFIIHLYQNLCTCGLANALETRANHPLLPRPFLLILTPYLRSHFLPTGKAQPTACLCTPQPFGTSVLLFSAKKSPQPHTRPGQAASCSASLSQPKTPCAKRHPAQRRSDAAIPSRAKRGARLAGQERSGRGVHLRGAVVSLAGA